MLLKLLLEQCLEMCIRDRYRSALEKLNITHSMSRVGKCIDNGPMEGLFGNIKVEKYYLKKYKTLSELEKDISEYIKFYNEERLQKNLGNRSPIEYRKFKEKNVVTTQLCSYKKLKIS